MEKEQFNRLLLAGIILWLVLLGLRGVITAINPPPEAPIQQTAYDRIMATRTIRCGYVLYPPAVMKDPNTGQFSGIAYDLMQEVGKVLNLNIEWTEEVTFATNVQGLQDGRYDAVCITYWMNPNEGKFVNFSTPFYYSALVPVVSASSSKLKSMNDLKGEQTKIATVDGSVASRIAQSRFPKAEIFSLPNTTSVAELLMAVSTKKADVAFVEPFQLAEWNKNNQESKLASFGEPLAVFPNVIALAQNDGRFKTMIDAALTDLINSGKVDQILDSYETHKGSFYRLSTPYQKTLP